MINHIQDPKHTISTPLQKQKQQQEAEKLIHRYWHTQYHRCLYYSVVTQDVSTCKTDVVRVITN